MKNRWLFGWMLILGLGCDGRAAPVPTGAGSGSAEIGDCRSGCIPDLRSDANDCQLPLPMAVRHRLSAQCI